MGAAPDGVPEGDEKLDEERDRVGFGVGLDSEDEVASKTM
jgi:hypothetical protein